VSTVATSVEGRPSLAGRVGGFAQSVAAYLRDVRAEVRKVSWPTWDDLRRTTMVIIVFVIVIGLIIGLMDVISSWVLIDLLGRIFR
jgi:preprotein translocase subunit SecE